MTERPARVGILARYGLRPIINVAGPNTPIGAAPARPEVIAAVAEILGLNVEMDALQERAAESIARASSAESGWVTACAAAGISLAVAACMTGDDRAKVERLPDTSGLCNEVLIQKAHSVNVGGVSVGQLVRLTGARLVEAGTSTSAHPDHLRGAIGAQTAAILFVVAQSTQRPGLLPLECVLQVAGEAAIPVIVDAAAETDLAGYIRMGADLAIYSAHKFLRGATAGIVCGRADLVRSVRAQEHGLGRPMKVGKEGVAGVIAALDCYDSHGADGEAALAAKAEELAKSLRRVEGLSAIAEHDAGCYPRHRVHIELDPLVIGMTAAELARALDHGPVAIKTRQSYDLAGKGHLIMDPAFFDAADTSLVVKRFAEILAGAKS